MPVWLFAPANAPRKAQGALASAAGQVVLDLEDAVPDAEKPAARAALATLAALPRTGRLYVRVNATGRAECLRDIQAAVAIGADGIMLPKTEGAGDAAAVDWALTQCEAAHGSTTVLDLVPLIETARGLLALPGTRWPARVRRVAFGSVDYEADIGLSGPTGAAAVDHARHMMAIGSRAAGLAAPIDGVTLSARDADLCRRDAAHARGAGFGGKLAIHPAQIAPIQSAFLPSADELDWAAEVVARFADAEQAGSGVLVVRGQLVDAPVVARARQLLALGAPAP